MTGRSVVIGRDGRAKAYRPLPDDRRAEAVAAGVQAYAADDFFEAHELWEPAWMGTDVAADRALLQGLIKLAARTSTVSREPGRDRPQPRGRAARLVESEEEPAAPNRAARFRGSTCPRCSPRSTSASRTWRPTGRPDPRPARPAEETSMNHPMPCRPSMSPRRTADSRGSGEADPLDVREPNEFEAVRAPGAVLLPTSEFAARLADVPQDRPCSSSATWAAGPPR
jgi:hypothetical protein